MAALSHLQPHTGEDTSRRAFVGNLPWDLSEDEIKDHFVGTCGAVTAVTIFLRHDQKVRAGVCDMTNVVIVFCSLSLSPRVVFRRRARPGVGGGRARECLCVCVCGCVWCMGGARARAGPRARVRAT